MTTPLVLLSSTTKDIGGLMRVRLNEAYVNAARSAGLAPLVLPPVSPDDLPPMLDAASGVIITGGEDIAPAEYGAAPHPQAGPPHIQRDKCEIALARLARERGIPTLAICRGIQAVNVAFGGTLIQDIPSERPSDIKHDQSKERATRLHPVSIERESKLARAIGASEIVVNSSHHQSIDKPAAGLKLTAHAPDGIVEGAEWSSDDWWMLGVQWHPEELVDDAKAWDRGLFRAFAREAAQFQRRLGTRDGN
ncbi:MAG TPA: gamma-glutamyl-gamma-aminobutyrate hydrolase family protein [Gemmatimonadaceae bacterium]